MHTSNKQKRNPEDEDEQKPRKRVGYRKSHFLELHCNYLQELTIEARKAIDYSIRILGQEQAAFLLERILYAAAGEGGDPAFSQHKLPFSFLSSASTSSTTTTTTTTVKKPSTRAILASMPVPPSLPENHHAASPPPTVTTTTTIKKMPALKIIPPIKSSQLLLPSPTSVIDHHHFATPPATTATTTTSPNVKSPLMELAGAACEMRELELRKLNELKPVLLI